MTTPPVVSVMGAVVVVAADNVPASGTMSIFVLQGASIFAKRVGILF